MIGAAWKDTNLEGGNEDSAIDRDNNDSKCESKSEAGDDDIDDVQTKVNTKRLGGISLVNSPNRLKKFCRHVNEKDPILFTEYEMRLRE